MSMYICLCAMCMYVYVCVCTYSPTPYLFHKRHTYMHVETHIHARRDTHTRMKRHTYMHRCSEGLAMHVCIHTYTYNDRNSGHMHAWEESSACGETVCMYGLSRSRSRSQSRSRSRLRSIYFSNISKRKMNNPFPTLFHPASQCNRGPWYQRPGVPLMAYKTSLHPGLPQTQLNRLLV